MNKQIKEDYVSFETAKLLREKGFEGDCYACYEYFESGVTLYNGWTFEYKGNPVHNTNDRIKCPTLQITMKWLREIYKTDICVCRELDEYGDCFDGYIAVVYSNKVYRVTIRDVEKDLSFEEAAEAAIKYCLTNLI